jgi:hypothetical protein
MPDSAKINPVTRTSVSPAVSTAKTRPASSVFFHALKALIRSNPDHNTFAVGSAQCCVKESFTMRRPWLNAKRDARA